MTINWDSVEGAIAGLTDAEALQLKLNQLKNATIAAEQIAQLKARYETADKLRAEAAGMLAKVSERQAELDRRETALAPAESKLLAREKQLAEREQAVTVREREAQQRHAQLSEIARTAAVA